MGIHPQIKSRKVSRVHLRSFLIASAFCLSAFNSCGHALDIPPKPQGYVYDAQGILSGNVRSQLNTFLAQFERQTSNQIVVAVFETLDGQSLEDFSIRLAEAWKPGQREKDNGVLLVLFKQDRLIRIEVGYGLEGVLTDVQSGLIIRQVMTPLFIAGRFDDGVLAGTAAIAKAVQGEYQSQAQPGYGYERPLTPEEAEALRQQGRIIGGVVLVLAGMLFLFDVFRYGTYRRQHRIYKNRYTFWEWFFRFAVLLAVLSFIFRMFFYAMLFSRGGSGGRGGGFSSGGGSFGGGGASGRW